MSTKLVEASDGLLDVVDEETGQVVARQKLPKKLDPKKKRRLNRRSKAEVHSDQVHHVFDASGKKRLVVKGMDPSKLPREVWPYSEAFVEQIVGLLIEGHTLTEIGLIDGMPSRRCMYTWMTKYKEFEERVKKARQLRAEYYHDAAITTAEDSNRKTIHSDRLKVDTYKWAAGVADREQFGNHTKITGDVNAPIGFIINTGIQRDEPKDVVAEMNPSLEKSDE